MRPMALTSWRRFVRLAAFSLLAGLGLSPQEARAGSPPAAPAAQQLRANPAAARSALGLPGANVLDRGADSTGLLDSAAAFTAASADATATRADILVPPGNYNLTGNASAGPNMSWELRGTRFSGLGQIADTTDWSPFLNRVSAGWIRTSNEPGNAFGTVTQVKLLPSGATANYEKAAGYDSVTQGDPSSYGGNELHLDGVGRQMSAASAYFNRTARIWGSVSGAHIVPSSDGYAQGAEFDIINDGSDQPFLNNNAKTGISVVAMGSNPATNGIMVQNGGQDFHDGIVVYPGAVRDNMLRLPTDGVASNDWFRVSVTGDILFNSMETRGDRFQVDGNGEVAGHSFTVPNSRAFIFTDTAGGHAYMSDQGDDNFLFYGTNSSGGTLPLFNVRMRSDAPTFNFNVPVALYQAPALADSSSTAVSSAWVRGQGFLTRPAATTVAALGACNVGNEGARASVSDAASPSFLAVLAGGGSVHAPAYCNGAAWVAG